MIIDCISHLSDYHHCHWYSTSRERQEDIYKKSLLWCLYRLFIGFYCKSNQQSSISNPDQMFTFKKIPSITTIVATFSLYPLSFFVRQHIVTRMLNASKYFHKPYNLKCDHTQHFLSLQIASTINTNLNLIGVSVNNNVQ